MAHFLWWLRYPSTLLARVFGASFYSIFTDLRTDADVYNIGTC